jgi:hypothetical protein
MIGLLWWGNVTPLMHIRIPESQISQNIMFLFYIFYFFFYKIREHGGGLVTVGGRGIGKRI